METSIFNDQLKNIGSFSYKSTSVINLQKSISQDLIEKPAAKKIFIPFIKERDGIGKLLSVDPEPMFSTPTSSSKIEIIYSTPKHRLLKKPLYPSVGSYNLPLSWTKKSYSVKSIKPYKSHEVNASPYSVQTNTHEKYKPSKSNRHKYKLENAIDRKARRINVQRPLNIWDCLNIYGTPEEIDEELKFSHQRAAVKKYQLEIKTLINKLKR